MSTLQWITAAALAGGACSALIAAALGVSAKKEWIPSLVSFAVGALLGAAFLELLPHAFAETSDPRQVAATVLAGILGFFVLEKLVIWRHSHGEEMEVEGDHHAHAQGDHGRSGLLILIGDSFHNFVEPSDQPVDCHGTISFPLNERRAIDDASSSMAVGGLATGSLSAPAPRFMTLPL